MKIEKQSKKFKQRFHRDNFQLDIEYNKYLDYQKQIGGKPVSKTDFQKVLSGETIDDTEVTFLSKDDLAGDIGNSVNFANPRFPYPKTNFDTVFKIRKKAIQQILKYDIADKINEDKFIGWPLFSEVDGFCVDNILDNLDPLREKYRVSKRDSHPNGPGHEVISEEIYKVYKKVYG